MKRYIAAKYLRLSDADRDKSGSFDLSESIENQDRICSQWLEAHPEVQLYDTYIDDGHTGLDYDRLAFIRMKKDIEAGVVNMVLIKSLSRFGREQIDTLTYVKRYLPQMGIRLVAVVDGVDTVNEDDGISVSMKILMNDYYSQNTSVNIRSALRAKRSRGLFIGAQCSYGYVKDPDDRNHLLVDERAARVVKRIFRLFMEGYGISNIRDALNDENILCPSEYKARELGQDIHIPNKLNSTHYWTYDSIKHILKNRVYTGAVVQHQKEKTAYNQKQYRAVPREEWDVVEDCHEAIISKDDFARVQSIMQTRFRKPDFNNLSVYAGLIFCGDCGRAMTKQECSGMRGHRYRCGTYARVGKRFCSSHIIYTEEIDRAVLWELRKLFRQLPEGSVTALCGKHRRNSRRKEQRDALEELIKRREALASEKKEMLRLLAKKVVAEADYMQYNEGYQQEYEKLESRITKAKQEPARQKQTRDDYLVWLDCFEHCRDIEGLSREIIVNLIERIEVFEGKKLHIKFLFRNVE